MTERWEKLLGMLHSTTQIKDFMTNEISEYAENNLVIISFANKRYQRIALNWVCYLDKLEITNYAIVSLDEETYDFLKSNNINTIFMEGTVSRQAGSGWKWRTNKLYMFLESGLDVIHSDLDAVWLKNPLELVESEYDIIASSVVPGFPPETSKRWGFTMCMGWMFYRSTTATLSFFAKMLEIEKDFDDQIEVNDYLSSRISLENIYNMMDGSWKMKLENLNIKVLNKGAVKRGGFDENAYVCHPLMKKHADCETQLKRRELWVL